MKLRNPQGIVTMEIKSLEPEDDHLTMSGLALGTMGIVLEITPDDIWEGLTTLVSWKVFKAIVVMVMKGFLGSLRASKRWPLRPRSPTLKE
jgi:hypothetical protein